MDIACFTTGCSVDNSGLDDFAVKIQVGPSEKWNTNLDAHLFLGLGEEVDLWGSTLLFPGLSLKGGGSLFRKSDSSMEGWGWLMLDAQLGTVLQKD